ncbi:MAG: four helix bundle protein [Deltaproteobacteria bacterium]|nr:four helix bundle protein [Deltaproteobacteria bacterium]
MVKTFRDLLVWQKGMELVIRIYEITRCFPGEEIFGLKTQLRRSAVSIPSNIAEGFGRRTTGEYIRFLSISTGSLFELQTQLEIACSLNLLEESLFRKIDEKSRELERMLSVMIKKLKDRT